MTTDEHPARPVLGRRACARPAGCCVTGSPADWCAALRASLVHEGGGLALVLAWPRLNARIATAHGPGRVVRVHTATATVTVALDEGGVLVEAPVGTPHP